MKNALILFICFVLSLNIVWAQEGVAGGEYKYDCGIAASNVDNLIKGISDSIGNYKVFKEDDIKIAYNHLKSYCAKKGYLKDGGGGDSKGPDSPYFFDHLIDVGFRKLDGDEKSSYGNELDPDGKQRRKEIKKIAEDPKGTEPGKILSLFNQYRDVKGKDQTKLSTKYNLVCEEAFATRLNFYQAFSDENIRMGYDACMNISSSRVNSEITYDKYLMVNKGLKYLKDAMHNYLMDYFVNEKLATLTEKMAEIQGKLGQWAQKVNGAKDCSGGGK